jgi:O-antigen ligase
LLLKAYLGAGLLVALAASIYYLGFSKTPPLAQPWRVPVGNRDFLAGILLVPLGITLAQAIFQFLRRKNWKRGLIFSGLALFLLIIFGLTRSKAGILSLAVTFFVVLLFIVPRRAKVAITLATLIIAGSALVVYKSFPVASQWLHSRYAYRSLLQRYYFWGWSLKMVAERPLLGWGAGTFVAANGSFSSIDRFRYLNEEGPYFLFADATVHSHNEFLEVMVELGVVGLTVYLLLLCWVVVKGITGSKKITTPPVRFYLYGLFGGFIGLCVQSFFSVGLRYWDLAPYFWTSVGALLAAGSLSESEERLSPIVFGLRGKKLRLVIFLMLLGLVIIFWYQVVQKGYRAQMNLYQADILREDGEDARAVPYYRKAKEDAYIYPDLVRGQYALGKILFNLRRWQEARETLETVDSLAADFIYTNLLLANVYEQLGEKEKALTFFRKYWRQNPYDENIPIKIKALVREIESEDAP